MLRCRIIFAIVFTCVSACVRSGASTVEGDDLKDDALRTVVASLSNLKAPQFSEHERGLAAWGRALFRDPRFSADGRTACSSCHDADRSFTDGFPTPQGRRLSRNTPTLVNVFASKWFFWDGRADSLQAQVFGPLESNAEMNCRRSDVARVIGEAYRTQYEHFFGPWPERALATAPRGAGPKGASLNPDVELLQRAVEALRIDRRATLMREARRAKVPEYRLFAQQYLAPAVISDAGASAYAERYATLPLETRDAVNRVAFAFAKAIAEYERGLTAFDSPFDRFASRLAVTSSLGAAFDAEFGPEEWRGLRLFAGRANCVACHSGGLFSDGEFHNVGLSERGVPVDLGRAAGLMQLQADPLNCRGGFLPRTDAESCRELEYLNRRSPETVGAFKTPTLRNVAMTAPYEHDGRLADLGQVLRHYNDLTESPWLGHRDPLLVRLGLKDQDLHALEAFLRSLTSPIRDLSNERDSIIKLR